MSPRFRLTLAATLGRGLVGLSLASAWGCGSALTSAVEAFEAGRHPEAAGQFRALEVEFSAFEPDERLRYALYRGLNALALGDARNAERWLSPVKRALDRQPLALTHAERGRLLAAWRSMGRMPGE